MAAKVLGVMGGHTRERRNHSFLYVDHSSEKAREFPGCLQRPELTFHGLEGFHSLTPKPMPVEPKGMMAASGGHRAVQRAGPEPRNGRAPRTREAGEGSEEAPPTAAIGEGG